MLFNIGNRLVGELASEGRRDYAKWVIEELQRAGVPLPEEDAAFAARLTIHAENRENREGAFSRPEEVYELLDRSGFDVRQCFESGVKLANPMQGFVSKLSKRRFSPSLKLTFELAGRRLAHLTNLAENRARGLPILL